MNNDANVRTILLEKGAEVFLQCGYDKASMRQISAAANVTTGAMYFFFRNKEDFFHAIVGDTAETIKALIHKYTKSEMAGEKTSAENESELIRYIYQHKLETRILLERAQGTVYEGYRDELSEILEDSYYQFFIKFGGKECDRDIAKIIARIRLQEYLELLRGDYTMEEALKYVNLLAAYEDSGFVGLMKYYIDELSTE